MEDIPKENFRDLRTSLNEIQASRSQFTQAELSKQSGVEESQVLAYLTDLCEQEEVVAKINIRCPDCNQDHGKYSARSLVPDDSITCFCGCEFEAGEQSNWTVVYEFTEDVDFFRNLSESSNTT